jgi:hypothetical protein
VKRLLTLAFLLVLAFSSVAQAACEMTVVDLPAVHGVRLGTSRREVEKVYSLKPTTVVYRLSNKENVEHIEGIWFDFYQDSLSHVEFDYDRASEWKNVREFAAFLERSIKLPIDSWVFVDRTEAVMKCQGFSVSISSVRNTLSLTDAFSHNAARQDIARTAEPTRQRISGQ